MDNLFQIGEVVTYRTHPYTENLTSTVISGDNGHLPPLMVVNEVIKADQQKFQAPNKEVTYKYVCQWFSSQAKKFEHTTFFEDQLKLVESIESVTIDKLQRGTKAIFKTANLELKKVRSSVIIEGTTSAQTSYHPLLTYLPPVLLVTNVSQFTSKNPLKAGEEIIRLTSDYLVKCTYFSPSTDKIVLQDLPIDALQVLPEIDESVLKKIQDSINTEQAILLASENTISIIKPTKIVYRSGFFLLNGYDFVYNTSSEYLILPDTILKYINSPFLNEHPKFEIQNNPRAASNEFIQEEFLKTIKDAGENKNFIRIKYKNRHGELSIRTLKEFHVTEIEKVEKTEKKKVVYLTGHCMIRNANRNFRLDGIQSLQELDLCYAIEPQSGA